MVQNDESIKEKTVSNLIWRFAERTGAQLVGFIVSIILARVLGPDTYGTVALITVFTTIFQVFVDNGLGNALIQKKNADQLDFSTVFYTNLALCTVLYLILFFISPFIAKFYGDPSLCNLTRVIGLTILISSVKNVQQAYVSWNLIFKKFFFSTLIGTIVAAIEGIWMAYHGFGAWALAAQQVINTAIDTCVLWLTVKWRPTKEFSFERLKGLFSYGWKLLVSALIDTVYNNVRQLIIGKYYSSSELAYYNRGKQIPNVAISNINTSIDSVLLPVMASEQDDPARVRSMTRRSIKVSIFVIAPIMFGIAGCAEPLIRLLLTDSWMGSVFYLRVFCLSYSIWPIHTENLNAIKAMGRSDLFLKLEIIKKIIGVLSIIITVPLGVKALAMSLLVTGLISQVINAWPNKKLLNYSYFDQVRDIMPSMLLSIVMSISVAQLTYLRLSDPMTLLIQVVCGICIYVIGSKIFKFEEYDYIKNSIKHFTKKKFRNSVNKQEG